jgi:hypothetical protein
LLDDPRPLDRAVLVTDTRVGLNLGERGQEYFDDLRERGSHRFQRIDLPFREYAELEALQRVVGMARSRDLEIEIGPGQARAVSEREVIEAQHRAGRYLASNLLRAVLDWSVEPASEPPELMAP